LLGREQSGEAGTARCGGQLKAEVAHGGAEMVFRATRSLIHVTSVAGRASVSE
jgi:hypothetical protein